MSPRAAWRLESLGFSEVFDYVGGKLDWRSAGLPIEGTTAGAANLGIIARKDVPTCTLGETIAAVRRRLGSKVADPCVVINDHRIVVGLLRQDAIPVDGSRTVEEVMLSGPSTFRPNVSLEEVDKYLSHHLKLRQILVTTPDGELVGLASVEEVQRRLASDRASQPY